MIHIIGKVIHLAVQCYLTSVTSMNIKPIILFLTHLQIIIIDFQPSPVNLWFNIKQTAIATMVAFIISTICLHYKNKVH